MRAIKPTPWKLCIYVQTYFLYKCKFALTHCVFLWKMSFVKLLFHTDNPNYAMKCHTHTHTHTHARTHMHACTHAHTQAHTQYTYTHTHLNMYASISLPLIILIISHWTDSSISAHFDLKNGIYICTYVHKLYYVIVTATQFSYMYMLLTLCHKPTRPQPEITTKQKWLDKAIRTILSLN